MPAPSQTPTDGYERKGNHRNNEIPTCIPQSGLGGGGGATTALLPMSPAEIERLYSGTLFWRATQGQVRER